MPTATGWVGERGGRSRKLALTSRAGRRGLMTLVPPGVPNPSGNARGPVTLPPTQPNVVCKEGHILNCRGCAGLMGSRSRIRWENVAKLGAGGLACVALVAGLPACSDAPSPRPWRRTSGSRRRRLNHARGLRERGEVPPPRLRAPRSRRGSSQASCTPPARRRAPAALAEARKRSPKCARTAVGARAARPGAGSRAPRRPRPLPAPVAPPKPPAPPPPAPPPNPILRRRGQPSEFGFER